MMRLHGSLVSLLLLMRCSQAAAGECTTPAQRVVSLGGAITEIVYALGQQHRLVGVDSTSQFPEAAEGLPDVGYYRRLSAEGLLSLRPDLLLTDADAGPPEVIDQIRDIGVCIATTPDGGSPAAIAARVLAVADALGVPADGQRLAARIAEQLDRLSRRAATLAQRPRVLFVLEVEGGAPVAAGSDTEAADIIELAGGTNAVQGYSGYKPLTAEAAVAAAPDYLLMMEHVVERSGGADRILELPALKLTPAGTGGRLIAMDGLLLLGFGPRTPAAVNTLMDAMHGAGAQRAGT